MVYNLLWGFWLRAWFFILYFVVLCLWVSWVGGYLWCCYMPSINLYFIVSCWFIMAV